MKEQIFQEPVQINSVAQVQNRLKITNDRYKNEIIPMMKELKENKIEMLKNKVEEAWYNKFETIIKR